MLCSNCGEVIQENFVYCPGCGSIVGKDKKNLYKKSSNKNSKTNSNAEGFANKQKNTNTDLKLSFSKNKLFYLIFFLLLVGLVIVLSSGIFDKASVSISQQPGNTDPHSGVDLRSLEQINSLEEKVNKNPNDKQSLLNLAHLLNDSGFKEKAIDRYKEYLKSDSKNADVLVDLGVCLFETKNNSEAIKQMEKALTIQPNHQIANLNLGIINMTIGNSSKAIEYWKKAVEINSTNEIGKKAQELIKSH